MAGKNCNYLLDSSMFLYPQTVTVISKSICTMPIKNNVGETGERKEEYIPFL